jgi:SAM-dependent methyltransferase
MANILEQALAGLSAGRVLDLATGEGGFVELLVETLQSYEQILGVDSDGLAVEAARGNLDYKGIQFVQMDGGRLGFADGCFDTVSVSASLHHLADVPPVLAEVRRVLRPGGRFVLAEMHRDGRTAAQRTVIAMHHWIADVATALGGVHNHTFARQELVGFAEGLGLRHVACYDDDGVGPGGTEPDATEETLVQELDGVIERTLRRAEEASNYESLRRRGEALKWRLQKTGAEAEPVVVVVGEMEL